MKNRWIGVGLLAALAVPAYAQEKEEERVENAGTVMKELNASARRNCQVGMSLVPAIRNVGARRPAACRAITTVKMPRLRKCSSIHWRRFGVSNFPSRGCV